jgi:2-polyprenyl-3-methyl-5-hydroxy-6-metoxy-1,4-benzoquinol methylase
MTTSVANKELDMQKTMSFAVRLMHDFGTANLAGLSYIGDKLGLFKALADSEPVTVEAFAQKTGYVERYLREWLSAMACAGYVEFNRENNTFTLPPEHATCLANPDHPAYMGSTFGMIPTFIGNAPKVAEAFVKGGGVTQEHYGEEFWCGFERMTRATFLNFLNQVWIPAMPDIHQKLLNGGTVADIGCGNGQALLILHQGYPNAHCVGYDNYELAIANANDRARAAGVSEQVRYEMRDVVEGLPEQYDLITTFDVVHDMVNPLAAMKAIRQALKPGGVYLMGEFNFASDLAGNIDHPLGLGLFGYTASTLYCMTTSLSQNGAGIGTVMGEAKARQLAEQAGFTQFKVLPFENPIQKLYEIRA